MLQMGANPPWGGGGDVCPLSNILPWSPVNSGYTCVQRPTKAFHENGMTYERLQSQSESHSGLEVESEAELGSESELKSEAELGSEWELESELEVGKKWPTRGWIGYIAPAIWGGPQRFRAGVPILG